MVERATGEKRTRRELVNDHKRKLEAYKRARERLGGKSGFQVTDHQIKHVLQSSIDVMEAAKALGPKSNPYLLQDMLDRKSRALFFDILPESLSLAISLFKEERHLARKHLEEENGFLASVLIVDLLVHGRLSQGLLRMQEETAKSYLGSCAVITFLGAKQLSGMSSSEARRLVMSRGTTG